MSKANLILENSILIQKLIDLMKKANKAIMDVYKESNKAFGIQFNINNFNYLGKGSRF